MKSVGKVGIPEVCRFRYRTDATTSDESKSEPRRVARAMLSSCATDVTLSLFDDAY